MMSCAFAISFAAEAFDSIALRLQDGEIPLRPGADKRILRRRKARQDTTSCRASGSTIPQHAGSRQAGRNTGISGGSK